MWFAAVDTKSGLVNGAGFALLLIIGDFVNSAAEQGIFRGLSSEHSRWKVRCFWEMVAPFISMKRYATPAS